MVFAKTSKAASRLSESVRTHKLKKQYLAVIDGICPQPSATLKDYLIKDSRRNMTSVTDEAHGKYSELSYTVEDVKDGKSLVRIDLKTGRPHQIRVQFASRGLPLVNDQRYHPHPAKGQIALYACRLSFPHPVQKQEITVEHEPPRCVPWNIFEVDK